MQNAKLQSYTVWFNHSEEYHHLKGEIFTRDLYYFETTNPTPVIIDAGAHIGLATLYFKKVYPAARVIAIEPLPENFKLLEKNVWENQLENVELHNVALAARTGTLPFYTDATDEKWHSTASFISGAWNHTQRSRTLSVPAQPLSDFLHQPVDFLKLDIEGAEQEVLFAAADQIRQVKHLIMEFHPTADQSLAKVYDWLADYGFTITLWKDSKEVDRKHAKGLVLIEAQQ